MVITTIAYLFGKVRDAMGQAAGDDRGIGVVEVILILVVLIGLVVIFRDQLTTIVNGIFSRIADEANTI